MLQHYRFNSIVILPYLLLQEYGNCFVFPVKKIQKQVKLMKKKLQLQQKLFQFMKLTLVQLCITIIFVGVSFARDVSAQETLSRKVSLRVENVDILNTLNNIEKQADVKFTYRDNLIDNSRRVSLNLVNETLENVLNRIFNPINIKYRVVNNQIILSKSKNALGVIEPIESQQNVNTIKAVAVRVSGLVSDESGDPLVGVNIGIKGTSQGTVSDAKGQYSIDVSSNESVLVFSFVGYSSQEITVGSRTKINVSLSPNDKVLDEVVVVGFGTQKKENLTGAVSTVNSKALADRPIPNVAVGLQGVSPGLNVTRVTGQPGAEDININIRGATSTSSVPPLLLVDGVIVPISHLQSMNPNDIDNISILKDAASTSIYGVDGAGGVILVTTKKGKEGKVKFQYSGLTGIDYALSVPNKLSLADEAAFSNLARVNSGQSPEFNAVDLENIKNGVPYVVDPNNPTAYRYYNNDPIPNQLLDKVMRMTSHSLTASGGSKNATYLVSGAYYYKDGILKYGGDDMKRYNFRSNVSFNISKHLSLDTRLAYTNEYSRANPLYTSAGNLPGFGSGTNGQGVIWEIYRNRIQNPVFTPDGKINANANNAFATIIDGGYNNTTRNIIDGVATLKAANFVKGLQLRAILGITNRRNERNIFRKTVQRWLINTTGTPVNATNSIDEAFENQLQRNLQFLADYDFNIGDHKFHLLAGTQFDDNESDRIHTWATNLLSNDVPTINLADPATIRSSQLFDSRANFSGLYRLNYNYKDKYLFETSGRYDGSSRLSPEKRYQFFPSVSAGWNIHKENFWENIKSIDEFKIRASYGVTGAASNINSYNYINFLSRGTNVSFNGIGAGFMGQYSLPSAFITWEEIRSFNIGFNVGLFKNRLQLEFDRFSRTTDNLLVPLTLPASAGLPGPSRNDGTLKTWGWEADIRWRAKPSKDFSYSIGINVADNNNEIVRYLGRNIIKPGNNSVVEGLPLNSIWGLKTDGFFQTPDQAVSAPKSDPRQTAGDVRYLDLNGDGKLTIGDGTTANSGDFVMLGNSNPRYTFGVTFTAEYKALNISLFFQGVGKREIMANVRNHMPFPVAFQYPLGIHADYWTPENPNALFPRPFIGAFFNYWEQDRMVLDASYARLKNFQIGFTVPQQFSKKLKIDKARFFISGQDLFVISGLGKFKEMYDPETRTDANAAVNYPNVNGTNLFGNTDYPFFSTLSFGLNLNF
jgi:TonB-linked SusC/RagA family outer membrane protein